MLRVDNGGAASTRHELLRALVRSAVDGVLNLLDGAANKPLETRCAIGGGCSIYLIPQTCLDGRKINEVWTDGQHHRGQPGAGMLSWILADISAGCTRNNIRVTFVQFSRRFL